MRSIRTPVLAFLTTLGALFPAAPGRSQDQVSEKILEMVEAVRRAQRPEANMRITWISKDVDPLRVSLGGGPAEDLPLYSSEYTVTYKGIRSRIDKKVTLFYKQEPTVPRQGTTSSAVFDGTLQKELRHRPPSDNKDAPEGYLRSSDQNSNLLQKILYGNILFLENDRFLDRYEFSLHDGDTPGMHILDCYKSYGENSYGSTRRITIDGNRGFHITNQKVIREKDQSVDYEVKTTLKQWDGGRWFPETWQKIRYDRNDGSERIEKIIQITSVEFGFEALDEIFNLEFPPGTKYYDSNVGGWIVHGQGVSLEDAGAIVSEIKIEQSETGQSSAAAAMANEEMTSRTTLPAGGDLDSSPGNNGSSLDDAGGSAFKPAAIVVLLLAMAGAGIFLYAVRSSIRRGSARR